MKEHTNCLNCGAPLHYNETNYGSIAKCSYCDTEYHIDKLGRVEEYKVKLKMHNRIISFYIGSMQYEPTMLETTRLCDRERTYIMSGVPNITLTLHSYDIEDLEGGDENEKR